MTLETQHDSGATPAAIVRTLVGGIGQIFFCPGCDGTHSVNSHPNGPRWTYNGDPVRPTFTPSILVTTRWSANDPDEKDEICHSFVTDGRIQFLGDCTHALAGQTVALEPWPYAPGTFGDCLLDFTWTVAEPEMR